jgi:hypothetical protein
LLLLIAVLGESYPAELARYSATPISSVQRALDLLENDRLIASRRVAARMVSLNPAYPAVNQLRAFLLRIAEGYPEYQRIKESSRTRPRRRGKKL